MDILTESDFVHSLHVYSQSMIRQPPEIATRLENPRRNNIILDGELSCDLVNIAGLDSSGRNTSKVSPQRDGRPLCSRIAIILHYRHYNCQSF